ncbi:MAG: hypothetical protein NT080_04995 [Spirochaetes bacterium]|nr:hypothetical protein [Spirochaetota bacterium]
MFEFIIFLAAFGLPVAVLLFVTVRSRRKLVLPTAFFTGGKRPSPAALFLRTIRARSDLLFDLALALIAALAFSGILERPRGVAFAIDCSRSVISGYPGNRPLDAGLEAIIRDERLRGARVYAIGADTARLEPGIVDVTRFFGNAGAGATVLERVESAAARLERSTAFLGFDPNALNDPVFSRFARVVLVTDRFLRDRQEFERSGRFELLEVGAASEPWLYPAWTGYDPESATWKAAIVAGGYGGKAVLTEPVVYRAGPGPVKELRPGDCIRERTAYGFRLSFPVPGIYAIKSGTTAVPFEVPGGPYRPAGSGKFGEAMAGLFAFLPAPGGGDTALRFAPASSRPRGGDLTFEPADDRAAGSVLGLADPGAAYGATLQVGEPDRGAIALTGRSLGDEELPLLFWGALNARKPPPRDGSAQRTGEGWVVRGSSGTAVVNPPMEEYAGTQPSAAWEEPAGRRAIAWYWIPALLAAYAGKIAFMASRKGKKAAPVTAAE